MINYDLDSNEIYSLSELAKEKRRELDIGFSPIGDNIFKFIKEKEIQLIYMPIKNNGDDDLFFSAVYVSLDETDATNRFIGLNTNDYYDNQIFALAHELYHFYESTEIHLCRIQSRDIPKSELKANRFAAEFLLPTEKLEKEIKNINKGILNLKNWSDFSLLRFIANLHLEYKLPYKAIVRKLYELASISHTQYTELYNKEVRNVNSDYHTIGINLNSETFIALNTKTQKQGVSGDDIYQIIENYEDEIISITELIDALAIFDKKIQEFGLEEKLNMDILEDLTDMFEE
ncbi:MAG: ImmA/IrrE family metallo-endopeptidase [Sarcina sp.]